MRAAVEVAYASIKPHREQELAEMEAAIAEDLAWLREREHLILADPKLRLLYESLKGHQKPAESDDPEIKAEAVAENVWCDAAVWLTENVNVV
jgi:hypothetical protein